MNRCGVPLAALTALICLSGCYSLACTRTDMCITTRKRPEVVVFRVWIAAGQLQPVSLETTVQTLAAYPIDVLASATVALLAPFNPEFDVRFGPLGAVAGILLPGFTVTTFLDGFSWDGGFVVSQSEFETLLAATRGGDRRLREVMQSLHDVWEENWLSVEFVEVRSRLPEENEWLRQNQDHDRWWGNPPSH